MKQFRCGDIVPGCDATFEEDRYDRLLVEVASHARHDHDVRELVTAVADKVRSSASGIRRRGR